MQVVPPPSYKFVVWALRQRLSLYFLVMNRRPVDVARLLSVSTIDGSETSMLLPAFVASSNVISSWSASELAMRIAVDFDV